ncbi:hypothetical protein [Peribacillus huizhouensis]|uniref:Uncharacterized protein n=1 Tax=Peribacillus huizhouensis TaxID=1501239 RepID=A0ABR6CN70_9BACI|nr:hypothetical protein [Peribacillus huizhouensis]MBA9026449.1 hypothetical protein [Peribacillus huizhouensis]
MEIEKDVQEDMKSTKRREKWGCFICAFIMVILPNVSVHQHIDQIISHDGKTLDSSNVLVYWKKDNKVTSYVEEQEPESVEIIFSKKNSKN